MLEKQLKNLEELSSEKPTLADVCRFHNDLYSLRSKVGVLVDIKIDGAKEKQLSEQGFPALGSAKLDFDKEASKAFFADFLQIVSKHGQQGRDEIKILQSALQADEMDLEFLFRAAFDRDEKSITQTAEKLGIQTALLEYCLNTALGSALQNCRAEGRLPQVTTDWNHGYCPVCGSLPSIAELSGQEGKKHLLCSLCGNTWTFNRLTCVHCGNTDTETLAYFTSEENPGCRVDTCRACNKYLKVVDRRERDEGLMLEIMDIATLHLDLLAAKEGFSRS